MQVTASEFKLNLEKYLELVHDEDIWVTKNGEIVAKLINPDISAVDAISGVLAGKVPADLDRHTLHEELLQLFDKE
ncbi:MAG: type II toxin-antitoxin system prevent-host-death family antitoxin [Firmicutes bacterium]|nr:type II toxin-antitoxin system prevent-host-death family antitoxin [Bacillota bacterium]